MYRFVLPDLGEGVAEAEVTHWFVRPGDRIERDEPLVEILTDKAQVEIPSPVSGRVVAVNAEPGQSVPVGAVLVEIATDEPAQRRVEALPSARRLARTLGVDISAVQGSGPGGRVREADVHVAARAPGPAGTATGRGERGDAGGGEPLTGLRGTIAEHLTRAAAVPTVTNVDEADFTVVRECGMPPTAVTAWACVQALRDHPELNAWYEDGRLLRHDHVDLGLATQTADGLVVPVVRNAHGLSLNELAERIAAVSTTAREGRAAPGLLRRSTFTLTSAGKLGGLFATPLLNVPEVAIAGLYRIEPRPVVREGVVAVRETACVSVTFDHRVLDGQDAARFLARVIELIEAAPGTG